MNDYDVTNHITHTEPYTWFNRLIDIVWNFLTAVGFIAFAAGCGYLYSRFV